jgi:hypothetical protein
VAIVVSYGGQNLIGSWAGRAVKVREVTLPSGVTCFGEYDHVMSWFVS